MRSDRAQVIRTPRFSLRWAAELLWSLATHQVVIRYKETLFGFGWILLQPVALTVIFTYIFHRFAQVPSQEIPYPLFTATGLVAWSATALVMSKSIVSLAGYGALLKRVALPKIVLPMAGVISVIADLAVMALLLVGLFLYYGLSIPATAWWVLPLLALHLLLLIGLSCLASLAQVFIRDVGHAMPSLLQLWFFASPVFYPYAMVPENFRLLARWNPMSGLIEGYRAALLLGEAPPGDLLIPAVTTTFLLFAIGLLCFWRLEGEITDII